MPRPENCKGDFGSSGYVSFWPACEGGNSQCENCPDEIKFEHLDGENNDHLTALNGLRVFIRRGVDWRIDHQLRSPTPGLDVMVSSVHFDEEGHVSKFGVRNSTLADAVRDARGFTSSPRYLMWRREPDEEMFFMAPEPPEAPDAAQETA